jgi:hypothetical protein
MQPELLEASWATRQHKVQAEFTARGLLRVERGTIWDGPVTTRWTPAALLQRCFLGTALGSYTVKVTDAFHLQTPRQIFTKLTEKGEEVLLKMGQSSMVFSPSALSMQDQVLHKEAKSPISAKEVARIYREELHDEPLAVLLVESKLRNNEAYPTQTQENKPSNIQTNINQPSTIQRLSRLPSCCCAKKEGIWCCWPAGALYGKISHRSSGPRQRSW